jgi:flagellar assembly protein FliH
MEAARKQANAEGHAAGAAEAAAGTEQATANTLRHIGDALGEIDEHQTQANQTLRQQAALLAVTAVRRIFPALAERHGLDEIEAFLADCLNHIGQLPRITVRVSADATTDVEHRLSTLVNGGTFDGRFAVEPDPAMGPGDCRIVWDDGGAERNAEQVWSQIDAAVERFLNPDAPHPDGAATGPDSAAPDTTIDDAPDSTTHTDDGHPTIAENAETPVAAEAAAAPDATGTEPANPE